MRLNFLSKNRTGENGKTNFIAYAIQEIILVVIGILIAVSLNNWNENRKRNNELDQLLTRVQEDLKTDLAKINDDLI